MGFQKTKRAHALTSGESVCVRGLDGPVHTGFIVAVHNSPKRTRLEFDDGCVIDLSRNHPVEILVIRTG